jgi:hypothetical protein
VLRKPNERNNAGIANLKNKKNFDMTVIRSG